VNLLPSFLNFIVIGHLQQYAATAGQEAVPLALPKGSRFYALFYIFTGRKQHPCS
jgi:hypothetical protein